jgi:DNA end-binding protein Ku
MPRALWTGTIAFGLVSVPVRMYPAIDEQDLTFHLVHQTDGSRIGYQKICKAEDRPVRDDEVVKAYEEDGELVLLEPEDFEAAEVGAGKAIDIAAFVPDDQIDPIAYERSYFLGPQEGSEKVYALLVEAMERSGLVGVVRFVFHNRDHLGALRVRDGVLVLASMYFADEIRPSKKIRPSRKSAPDKRELEMALDLVGRFEGGFEHASYEDRYRERLLEVIERKRKGGATKPVAAEEPRETPDLLTALRESLERVSRDRPSTNGRDGSAQLEEQTVRELSERARELSIEGRSKMSKDELVQAIRSAER